MYRICNTRTFGDDSMIIRGHFVADAPYFAVHLQTKLADRKEN
ncbi:MAG: hypothetical protein AB1567_07095 [bacterium]